MGHRVERYVERALYIMAVRKALTRGEPLVKAPEVVTPRNPVGRVKASEIFT